MSTFAIKSDHLVLPSGIDGFGYLTVTDGRFEQVSIDQPKDIEIVDRMGCWVAPGLVDTHIHGFAGSDVMDKDPDALVAASKALAAAGTCSWLPSTMTASPEETEIACASVRVAALTQKKAPARSGAHMQGIFLEGPFFTYDHRGAQDPKYLLDPDIDLLETWQDAAAGLIKKSALAPERDGALDYIRGAVARGVTVSIGHSSATYGEAAAAILAGATCVNHTFNGMDDMCHRNPGIAGLAMTSQGVYAEVIGDGIHVDPVVIDALVRAKGFEHVVLISDCLAPGGLAEGDESLDSARIDLRDGAAYLTGTDTLAGSVLTLARAVKNICNWGIATAEQAIRMASEVPARSVGLDSVCGAILPGRAADLTVFDGELNLVETYVSGHRY